MVKSNSLSGKRCLIVEDNPQTSDFLVRIVQASFPDLETIAVESVQSAKNWIENDRNTSNKPLALCLVDLSLPDGSGVELIRELKAKKPEAAAIVVTIYSDDSYLFEALAAGAQGYLLKEEEPAFLVEALKKFEKDEPPLSPSIARRILSHFHEKKVESDVKLTPREQETLSLLAQGMTIPEAAKNFGLSPQTVAGYVKQIYQKLHVSNRVELINEASRRRLI